MSVAAVSDALEERFCRLYGAINAMTATQARIECGVLLCFVVLFYDSAVLQRDDTLVERKLNVRP